MAMPECHSKKLSHGCSSSPSTGAEIFKCVDSTLELFVLQSVIQRTFSGDVIRVELNTDAVGEDLE